MVRLYIFFLIIVGVHSNIFSQTKNRPNVVFIFADDLGWGDLSAYGHPRLKTPCLDKLASEGRLFTQFYVNNPVCSPSRASVMTGRFPSELGIHGHLSTPELNRERGMPNFLDPYLPNLTRMLQQNGYATGHFGKWHLGHSEDAPSPKAYGIDESLTNTSNDSIDFKLWYPENRSKASKMVFDEAIEFIMEHKDESFYVNAWLVDPHAVLNPSKEQMEKFEWTSPRPYSKKYYGQEVDFYGAPQVYYATVSEMDKQVGVFLDKLESLGLSDNTIIIFSSDNGPEVAQITNASHSAAGSSGPFRGVKRSLYEGGVRVPFIVKWPNHIPEATVDTISVVSGVDFLPTIGKLCGIEISKNFEIDGEDMSSSWLGKPQERGKPLFWEWRFSIEGRHLDKSPMLAIRQGRWKLLMNPDGSRIELYDLILDPSELQNRREEEPDIVKDLSQQLMDWKRTLPEGKMSKSAGQNNYKWPKQK